jgi:glycosyltransferase involved in cell wall biosynthesis
VTLRLAVVVSHPIQYFAPWHREVARLGEVDLRVFFCCDWGLEDYMDPGFGETVKWDIPLLEGYEHEFLPITRRPKTLGFWEVDNPAVGEALDKFWPDVVQVFGYARRTNWRVASWARRRARPLMIYSDSNASAARSIVRRGLKYPVVRRFYRHVDGALYVGANNRAYHLRYGVPAERLFRGVLPIDRARLLGAVPSRAEARRAVRQRHGVPDEAFVVMYCGKYQPRKRPLDLAGAVSAAARGRAPVWALFVGEGPERAALEEFVRAAKAENVVLCGFVNQAEIPSYYAASDALALTSSYEPYGLVVSEAAAFGLPVVVSDQVGCVGDHDAARPGVNAIVYPSGDAARLREAIEALANDRRLYARMAAASAAVALEQDVSGAATALATAARELARLGPRRDEVKR